MITYGKVLSSFRRDEILQLREDVDRYSLFDADDIERLRANRRSLGAAIVEQWQQKYEQELRKHKLYPSQIKSLVIMKGIFGENRSLYNIRRKKILFKAAVKLQRMGEHSVEDQLSILKELKNCFEKERPAVKDFNEVISKVIEDWEEKKRKLMLL